METAATNLFEDPAVGGFVVSMRDVTAEPDRKDALIGVARERITPAQPVARRAA
jgi:hypothetical protein